MNIREILVDIENGMTDGEVMARHGATKEQVFALRYASDGLTIEQIEERIKSVEPGMKSRRIDAIMQGAE